MIFKGLLLKLISIHYFLSLGFFEKIFFMLDRIFYLGLSLAMSKGFQDFMDETLT